MPHETDSKRGSPPPYEQDESRAPSNDVPPSEPPPDYDTASRDHPEAVQAARDIKTRTQEPSLGPSERNSTASHAGPSVPPPNSSSSSSSSSMTPRSLVQSFKDKRRAKEAAKKVDYYEKMYGFVPKNVMTEAEWRDARDRAPKVKKPVTLESKSYFGPR